MGGGLEKDTVSKEGLYKDFILVMGPEIFCPTKPQRSPEEEALNLDQISSYCTFIKFLMRSLKYANMITF